MIEYLYLHIPFCPNICPYCAFFKQRAQGDEVERFLTALTQEITRAAPLLRPKTIFIGGGTPSALSLEQLKKLLGALQEKVDLSQLIEWTMEMNPATVNAQKATWLRKAGLNRMSMGVQSWDAELLQKLGRTHSAQKAADSFAILRDAGFENISLDLIFGTPGESIAFWEASLQKSVILAPEHLSAYALTYEEDTEFFRLLKQDKMHPEEELEAEKLGLTIDFLAAHGYQQYEISNFAKPGYESAHNRAYWLGFPYLGLGPSAFSSYQGRRYRNSANLEEYIASTEEGKTAIDFEEPVSKELLQKERAAFGLRTRYGLPKEADSIWQKELQQLAKEGLLEKKSTRWQLTRRGIFLADYVASHFV